MLKKKTQSQLYKDNNYKSENVAKKKKGKAKSKKTDSQHRPWSLIYSDLRREPTGSGCLMTQTHAHTSPTGSESQRPGLILLNWITVIVHRGLRLGPCLPTNHTLSVSPTLEVTQTGSNAGTHAHTHRQTHTHKLHITTVTTQHERSSIIAIIYSQYWLPTVPLF